MVVMRSFPDLDLNDMTPQDVEAVSLGLSDQEGD